MVDPADVSLLTQSHDALCFSAGPASAGVLRTARAILFPRPHQLPASIQPPIIPALKSEVTEEKEWAKNSSREFLRGERGGLVVGEVVEGTAHLKTEIDRARSVFWAFF